VTIEQTADAPPSRPLRLDIGPDGFGTLMLGDDDLTKAVNAVTIVARVGQPNLATCQQNESGVRVEVGMPVLAYLADGCKVTLRDTERAALIALGWTPPAVA
jgi:hypothetical protein